MTRVEDGGEPGDVDGVDAPSLTNSHSDGKQMFLLSTPILLGALMQNINLLIDYGWWLLSFVFEVVLMEIRRAPKQICIANGGG